MADRRTFILHNPQQAHKAIMTAWDFVKGWLGAGGQKLVMEIRPETRNDEQNRLLHASLGEISKQVDWAGAKRDTETWKRLMVSAWLRARGDGVEVLPALDGKGIDVVYARTSKLTKSECAELTEFVMAWAIENNVRLTAPENWR